ncbi:MAG: LacI family DNA-binding transcriptional regulator [Pseudomonadota bacterium]
MARTGAAQIVHGRRPRTTISDVAEHLNLTKSTVSRALNGYPDIAERTQLRVRNAANELGYRPLSQAQAIRTGRVRSMGIVVDVHEHDGHRPFLAEFLGGLSESAAREDWTLTVATATTEADTARLLRNLFEERKVDGFILPRTYERDDRAETLRAAGAPFVLFGRIATMPDAPFFDISGEAAMAEAVTRLVELGHRRIGFVPGGAGYTYTRFRREGYLAGLAKAGLASVPELFAEPAVTPAAGAAAARQLWTLPNPPSAIVYSVDRAAVGAYETARVFGLEIGRDVSIVSYDGLPEGALMQPKLSSFRVDMRRAGMRLAELLIRAIRGESHENLQEIAQAEFCARGSHGPCDLTSAHLAERVALSISKGGKT